MGLFEEGAFTLHSGRRSVFKIDCDALTQVDLYTLAHRLANVLPRFGEVEGVPTGGLRLARMMEMFAERGNLPTLLVDDVYTTGGSMEAQRNGREHVVGAVLFARRPVSHSWITALFTMAEGADE